MNSCHPPHDSAIFKSPKSKQHTLDLTDLTRVMLYTMFYKTAVLTPQENDGEEVMNTYNKLPDGIQKATFFWDLPVRYAPCYDAYLQRTYQMMCAANHAVSGLFDQGKGYLPFICKVCELLGVPPEVLEIQPETTIVSKVAELLQFLRHRSQTFNSWTISCIPSETLQNMKQYRRLLQFLQRVVTDRTFALGEDEYQKLQSLLELLKDLIDLSTFFSTLEGPHTDKYVFTWIESLIVLRKVIDAIWIEDCHTRFADLDQISDKLHKKIVKLWKFVHTRLSAEESMSEYLLVFLCNVLPHLIKTKYFLLDEDLFYSVKNLVKRHIKTLTNEQYSILRFGQNENVSLFFPQDFQAFSICLFKAVSCLHPDLHDVKNLQDDPDATLESLNMTREKAAVIRLIAANKRANDQFDYINNIDYFRDRSKRDEQTVRKKAAIPLFGILRKYSRKFRAIDYAHSLIPFLGLWDQVSVKPIDVQEKMDEIDRKFRA